MPVVAALAAESQAAGVGDEPDVRGLVDVMDDVEGIGVADACELARAA
jgi:hypothetical protein